MSRPLGLESMLVSGIPYLPIPAVHLQLSYGKSPFFWSNSMGWDPKPETRLKKWMCLMYPEIGYYLVINILLLKMEHRNSWFIFYRLWIFQLAIFVFTRKSTSIFLWFSYGFPMVFLWFHAFSDGGSHQAWAQNSDRTCSKSLSWHLEKLHRKK